MMLHALNSVGGKICTCGLALFIWQKEKELVGVLGTHVGNFNSVAVQCSK